MGKTFRINAQRDFEKTLLTAIKKFYYGLNKYFYDSGYKFNVKDFKLKDYDVLFGENVEYNDAPNCTYVQFKVTLYNSFKFTLDLIKGKKEGLTFFAYSLTGFYRDLLFISSPAGKFVDDASKLTCSSAKEQLGSSDLRRLLLELFHTVIDRSVVVDDFIY